MALLPVLYYSSQMPALGDSGLKAAIEADREANRKKVQAQNERVQSGMEAAD